MEAIARRYPGHGRDAQGTRPIPYLADLRIALNVAAADRQPRVVGYSPDRAQRGRMERELAQVAWSEPFVGQVQYVAAQAPGARSGPWQPPAKVTRGVPRDAVGEAPRRRIRSRPTPRWRYGSSAHIARSDDVLARREG